MGEVNEVDSFVRQLVAADERMRRLVSRLVVDRDALDDVLQTAYMKAFIGRDGFQRRSKFETWLYTIVYRACLDHLERGGTHGRNQSINSETYSAMGRQAVASITADHASSAADRLLLEEALGTMPVGQRAAIWLVDVEGHAFEDAAAILDVPPGTLASRLSRGRSALRRRLACEYGKEVR